MFLLPIHDNHEQQPNNSFGFIKIHSTRVAQSICVCTDCTDNITIYWGAFCLFWEMIALLGIHRIYFLILQVFLLKLCFTWYKHNSAKIERLSTQTYPNKGKRSSVSAPVFTHLHTVSICVGNHFRELSGSSFFKTM